MKAGQQEVRPRPDCCSILEHRRLDLEGRKKDASQLTSHPKGTETVSRLQHPNLTLESMRQGGFPHLLHVKKAFRQGRDTPWGKTLTLWGLHKNSAA